ncbi:hypothetical protein GQ600_18112 [Phytophthora cactorum]|nr:hypothetical protein GQ600_18112 [Phytophthora cactorum]
MKEHNSLTACYESFSGHRSHREAIATAEALGSIKLHQRSSVFYAPRYVMARHKENIPDLTGAQTSKSFKGQGATPIIPFSHDLETFMKDYFKEQQPRRLRRYMAHNESYEKSLSALMILCQRFAVREYEVCPLNAFNNVDETVGYLDMPPLRIWAWKGRKGSAKVKRTQKHAERLTAVVTARADGKKQPILFILRAKSG